MTLEIACFNITSAILAEQAGAHRIELCENPHEGGTTPSYGTLQTIKEIIGIPVFPIIRPRGGDFCYTSTEIKVIQKDIQLCKNLGYEGVVIGLLNNDGLVDEQLLTQLVQLAYPMEVTFHRAFDGSSNWQQALDAIIKAGCSRLLTSGQHRTAAEGVHVIKEIILKANDDIIIMPGSGLRSNNVISIAKETGAVEFHSSARTTITSSYPISHTMQEELLLSSVDVSEIKELITALQNVQ
jgi:copper homeostasis protein